MAARVNDYPSVRVPTTYLRTGSFDPRDGPRTSVPSWCGSDGPGEAESGHEPGEVRHQVTRIENRSVPYAIRHLGGSGHTTLGWFPTGTGL